MLVEAIKGIVNILTDHETILWSNSAPTSAFAGQTITLNDSIDNYEQLKFKYRISTTDATEYNVTIPVEDTKKNSSSYTMALPLGINVVGTANYVRIFASFSGNSVGCSNTVSANVYGSNNNLVIPLQIIGIKKDKKYDIKYVHEGTFSSASIKCGFKPSAIMIVDPLYVSGANKLTAWYDEQLSTTESYNIFNNTSGTNTIGGSNSVFGNLTDEGFDLTYYQNFSSSALLIAVK